MDLLFRKGGEMITTCFSWEKIAERRMEVKEKAKNQPMDFSLFRASA